MYHEEKMINGVLHWRGTPTGAWSAYTLEQLSERLQKAERALRTLIIYVDDLDPSFKADCPPNVQRILEVGV